MKAFAGAAVYGLVPVPTMPASYTYQRKCDHRLTTRVIYAAPVKGLPTTSLEGWRRDESHAYGQVLARLRVPRGPLPRLSSMGRGTVSNLREALFVGNNDLRAVDPDHIGISQMAQLPADVGPREAQILSQVSLR